MLDRGAIAALIVLAVIAIVALVEGRSVGSELYLLVLAAVLVVAIIGLAWIASPILFGMIGA